MSPGVPASGASAAVASVFLGVLLLLVYLASVVRNQRRRLDRDAVLWSRSAGLQRLLARTHAAASQLTEEQPYFQTVCELAAEDGKPGKLRLAWVGQPDDNGILRVVAAAGATDMLEVRTVSVRPSPAAANLPPGHKNPAQENSVHEACLRGDGCGEGSGDGSEDLAAKAWNGGLPVFGADSARNDVCRNDVCRNDVCRNDVRSDLGIRTPDASRFADPS